jgi:hypothetical protein
MRSVNAASSDKTIGTPRKMEVVKILRFITRNTIKFAHIYMCVCVCVCVCGNDNTSAQPGALIRGKSLGCISNRSACDLS